MPGRKALLAQQRTEAGLALRASDEVRTDTLKKQVQARQFF
ncbi:GNAT family N-acetyltransferase [Kosakonia cowanii]